jgi:hypothetical protein
MNLERLERHIRELEAIKFYPQVKEERNRLLAENSELRKKVQELEEEKKKLASELEELKEEVAKLREERERALKELGTLKQVRLRSQDGRELGLEEAREEFLRDMEAEVQRRVEERCRATFSEFEAQKPKLVYEELLRLLASPSPPPEIKEKIEAEVSRRVEGILRERERWPDWFRKLYSEEVQKGVREGLDEEFRRRAEERAGQLARGRLQRLVAEEWPRWYRENVEPGLRRLEEEIRKSALALLVGPWTVPCDKCGTRLQVSLEDQIGSLFSRGYAYVPCSNPSCRDLWILRHAVRIRLRDLVLARLSLPGLPASPKADQAT